MYDFQSPENPISHDDAGFLRPGAWEEAKVAFGRGSDVGCLLARLERCRLASPRLLLAAAINAFLSASPEQQSGIIRDYLDRRESDDVTTGSNGHAGVGKVKTRPQRD